MTNMLLDSGRQCAVTKHANQQGFAEAKQMPEQAQNWASHSNTSVYKVTVAFFSKTTSNDLSARSPGDLPKQCHHLETVCSNTWRAVHIQTTQSCFYKWLELEMCLRKRQEACLSDGRRGDKQRVYWDRRSADSTVGRGQTTENNDRELAFCTWVGTEPHFKMWRQER